MKKKLSKEAYGGVKGNDYVPYVTNKTGIKESTMATMLIGILVAIIFSASNTYAGMASGLTVAAGIPGAIIGATILKTLSKKNNILNTNMVQIMASSGESIASGVIFVYPAVIIIAGIEGTNFWQATIAGIAGAMIGVAVVSLVHNFLIVEEHGNLIYPESMAISETMVTSETGGESLKFMGIGALISSVFTALSAAIFGIFNTSIEFAGEKFKWQWSTSVDPLLVGIGFIVGIEVAVAMFAGSLLDNFVLVPLISYFTSMANDTAMVWNDPQTALNTLEAAAVHSTYTKYMGAGMMLSGGIIGAIKLIPSIKSSLSATFSNKSSNKSEGSNIAKYSMIIGTIGILISLVSAFMVTDGIAMMVIGIILVLFFSFIFAIVAANMTGTIGTSNLPVSGMTIASLLIITVIFLLLGWTSQANNITILLLATMVVVAISIAGGYAQSQKATFIVGGSKDIVQRNYVIGAVVGVIVSVACIILLAPQIQMGVTDPSAVGAIVPPQANLMATLTGGVLTGNLPWPIILAGIFAGIVLFLLDLPIMTVAIGLYLPMGTVTIILMGAILRLIVIKMYKSDEKMLEKRADRGIILSAGLVAGGALTGLVGAALASLNGGDITNAPFFIGSENVPAFFSTNTSAVIVLLVMCTLIFLPIISGKIDTSDE